MGYIKKEGMFCLIKSPEKKYLYDAVVDEIIEIDTETFHDLIENNYNSKSIKKIKDEGFLRACPIQEFEHPYTDVIEYFLERSLSSITLQLTQECNFRCSYCPYTSNTGSQRVHSKEKMSLETLKKAIDFLEKHSCDSKNINIGFYGGEPLIEYKMIQETISYAEKKFILKNLSFNMTTNGSLLTRDKIEYFSKHNIDITISLDGIKEINDKNRVFALSKKGTFDCVMKNLKVIMDDFKDFASHVLINMVVDPSNDLDLIEKIFKIEGIGKKIYVRVSFLDDEDKEDKTEVSENYLSKLRYQMFVEYVKFIRGETSNKEGVAKQIVMESLHKLNDIASGNEIKKKEMHGGICKPGYTKMFVDVEGRILPCEKVGEKICGIEIGSIDQGFFLQNVKNLLNIGKPMEDTCKSCWCFHSCQVCAKESNNLKTMCEDSKLGFYKMLKLKIMLKEIRKIHEEMINEEQGNYLSYHR